MEMELIKAQTPGLRGIPKDSVSVVWVRNFAFFNQPPQVTNRLVRLFFRLFWLHSRKWIGGDHSG